MIGVAGPLRLTAFATPPVHNRVIRDHAEPPLKRVSRRVAAKVADFPGDDLKHLLGDIGRIRLLQVATQAPADDERPVKLYQLPLQRERLTSPRFTESGDPPCFGTRRVGRLWE